ncbi:sugar ABC transporter substrate-binding protein [Paenibacillus psychroresistens]|uniref:Sugar ABC transporter substrate-binding protein n=1 Tax=Paenibacillus psychroresistens TaxID=1778678 RepID=A0A6B8RKU1_9BACL|nr:sugar ABC transporter substrate-binding protein [Paenibacillus psychroresistens]QGQ96467.1 sugar ABC transporter substrate-binding protein [Paenibacillus psychroresistens]
MNRPSTKKVASILLSLTMVLGILAGCASKEDSDASSSAPAGESGKKVTLHMIESLTSPTRTDSLKAILADFEKANPNIKVDLISPPFDQADNKITTMLAANQDLDVMEARDLNVGELVNNEYIEPLDTYTAAWKDFATVSGTAKAVGTVQGKLYFLANAMYQRQLFYRKDWFEEKGLKVPTTYQEIYEVGKQLTDPAKNRYGFSFRGGSGSNGTSDAMILSYNADNDNLEDSQFLKDGKTIYSSPEAKQAMELYVKIYKEASPKDSINWGFNEQVQAFTSGVTAMLLQDPDAIQGIQEKMKEGTWATAPIPVGPTGKALVATGAAGWAMVANSKNKPEAWKLIEFLSNPEQNLKIAKSTGVIALHTTASTDPFFQTGPYKTLLDMSAKADVFVNYKPAFEYEGTGQWNKITMEANQALLFDKATLEDTLKGWDAFWVDQKEIQSKKK